MPYKVRPSLHISYDCATFGSLTSALRHLLLRHLLLTDCSLYIMLLKTFGPETIAFQTFALPLFQNHTNHSALQNLLFKTNAIQDICYSDICYFNICSSVLLSSFYTFSPHSHVNCVNRRTIETYLKQVPADVATCWAKGYSLVVLYVFCQLGFRQNDCVTFVSCPNTLLNLLLTNLHHICLDYASS